jgi:hypothetical protein
MQIKTIKKVLHTKLIEWLKTISIVKLREDIKNNLLVSGGSITSMLLGEKVNDVDIYIKDRDVLMELVKYYTGGSDRIVIMDGHNKDRFMNDEILKGDNYYSIACRNLKDDQIRLYIKGGRGGLNVNEEAAKDAKNYIPLFFSPNAISLTDQIQIVIRFHGDDKAIHSTFDFIHATNYFTFKDGLVTNKEALESIITKQLRYQGSFYPVTSIIRAKKFLKRGWNISAGELMKIMFQISMLNLSNPDTLDEQLIGVDVAYFEQLIAILRNIQEKDPNYELTAEKFNGLIDIVFNNSDDEDIDLSRDDDNLPF